MYLFQLKPNAKTNAPPGSSMYQAIPLHNMFIQSSLKDNGQYLIPVQPPGINHEGPDQPQVIVGSSTNTNAILSYVEEHESDQATPKNQLQQSKKESPPYNLSMINPKNIFIKNENPEQDPHRTITNTNVTNDLKVPTDIVEKKKIHSYVHISDRNAPPRAVAVLPPSLHIRLENIYPRRYLHSRVRFGPVKGIMHKIFHGEATDLKMEAAVMKKPIFLLRRDKESVTYIDISDKDKSNWLTLLPLGDQNTANVWLYEEDNELYAITAQTLHPRTPLALGYSQEYALEHELSVGAPVLDIYKELSVKLEQWWCYECHRAMASSTLLQHHMDSYHREVKMTSRQRYRCKHCLRTFSRVFTLRRHIKLNCTEKPEKSESTDYSGKENVSLNTSTGVNMSDNALNQSVDENRLPSDESLQNYTNNLDFSTNLFDTDRMPNLDMSNGSRSDTDFNSFSIDYKDDTTTNNVFGLTNDQDITHCHDIQGNTPTGANTSSCSYKQEITSKKQRSNARTRIPRRFKCECCGQIYQKKEKLTQHILAQHCEKTSTKSGQNVSDTPYECQECDFTFKRRGMLVNHLRRVHNNMSVTVPLECSVKHYPCVACIKVYRTAAKRDKHVRKHHPGAELVRAQWIESGRRALEPAACEACPREYASRAKLLQHVRAAHPHLAAPVKSKRKSQQK